MIDQPVQEQSGQSKDSFQADLERMVAEPTARLRCIIDCIPDLIFFKDPRGLYLGCNRAFEAFVGRAEQELIGKTDHDLFPHDVAAFFWQKDRTMLKEGSCRRNEEWVTYPDGRRVLLDTLKTPYHGPDDEILGLIGISRDITERQEMAQKILDRKGELQKKNKELKKKNEEILSTQKQLIGQEKLASLGTMAAGIAHEIRNPLNFIQNFSGLSVEIFDELHQEMQQLRDKVDPKTTARISEIMGDLKSNLELINKHGKRADHIVRGMMGLSKRGRARKLKTDLNELVDDYTHLAWVGLAGIDSTHISVVKDYDLQLGEVHVLPESLGQVIVNLIANAVDSLLEKEKCARSSYQPELRVTTKQTEDGVEIHIRDNGKGLSNANQEKVFDPFFTTKVDEQGHVGLGLSISFDIVAQEHGGRLSVTSQEGEYADFVILLPR